MSFLTILIIAIALGLDSLVALFAIGASGNCQSKRLFLRLSVSIGLFHFFMPLIGSFFSQLLISYIGSYGTYLSAAIFALLGFKMIKEAFGDETPQIVITVTKAILLSYALSIDALATGFSLSLIKEQFSIYSISFIFAAVAFIMSYLGYYIGKRCSHMSPKYSFIVGGLALIALGIKTLF